MVCRAAQLRRRVDRLAWLQANPRIVRVRSSSLPLLGFTCLAFFEVRAATRLALSVKYRRIGRPSAIPRMTSRRSARAAASGPSRFRLFEESHGCPI